MNAAIQKVMTTQNLVNELDGKRLNESILITCLLPWWITCVDDVEAKKQKRNKAFDMSRYRQRHIALHVFRYALLPLYTPGHLRWHKVSRICRSTDHQRHHQQQLHWTRTFQSSSQSSTNWRSIYMPLQSLWPNGCRCKRCRTSIGNCIRTSI